MHEKSMKSTVKYNIILSSPDNLFTEGVVYIYLTIIEVKNIKKIKCSERLPEKEN